MYLAAFVFFLKCTVIRQKIFGSKCFLHLYAKYFNAVANILFLDNSLNRKSGEVMI